MNVYEACLESGGDERDASSLVSGCRDRLIAACKANSQSNLSAEAEQASNRLSSGIVTAKQF